MKKIFYFIIFCAGFVQVLFFLCFDFNSYILSHFSIQNKATPSTLYIPQEIITNDSLHRIKILILGGSSAREFFPRGSSLDSMLSQVCGHQVFALNAGTSSQSLADSAAILDATFLIGAQPDVIIVGMTKFRLSHVWGNWSDVLAGQLLALPISSTLTDKLSFVDAAGWNIRDRFNQVARLAPLLDSGSFINKEKHTPIPALPDYNKQPIAIKKKLEQALVGHSLRNEIFVNYAKENAEYFVSSFSPYAKSGAKIIFLFTPISPATRLFEAEGEAHMNAVKNVLSQIGQVVDLRNYTGVNEQMFYDEQHLRPEGRLHVWENISDLEMFLELLCNTK